MKTLLDDGFCPECQREIRPVELLENGFCIHCNEDEPVTLEDLRNWFHEGDFDELDDCD